ncbi:MAG: hypothetical protein NZL93_03800, partial [Chthoniobacterales bacterium]|nr:hypothetical protein [Chthoniobacterales bacterium]
MSVLRAAGSVLLLLVLWFDGHGPRSRREERSLPVGSRERESGGDGSEKNTGSVIVPPPLGGWVLVGLVFGVVVSAQCESAIPPDGMLEKLKERLLAPGPEFPNAASIPFAELEVDGERLKVMAEVEVATGCAVPLPLLLDGVTPLWVRVDGRQGVPIMRHEGSLWAALPKGVYRVEVDGLLGKGERWEWGFLLQPKRVRVEARGWRFSGVGENGKPDNRIFFYSTRGETDTSDGEFGRGNELDAGVVIERKVFFGSLWLMESRMKRLSGEGLAVSKSLPLMAGERVLTEGLLVEEGKMRVTLGAGERERVWVSEFMQGGGIELVMADGADWAERWGVKASCFWVVNWRGASPYYDDSDTGVGLIAWWQPEPGERLRLEVRRPEMVEGATMKVQRVERVVNIGKEVTEEELRADVEASMGGSLRVELPDGVGVDVLEVNSERLPVVVREDVINVPLKPGMGQVFIKWTKKSKESFLFEIKEGEVIFGAGVSNILTRVHSGGNRWILWAWGPRMGPAVELWAVLVLGLAGAVVLSKLPGSPLKIGEWVLLSLGLTQIPVYGGLFFVGWLFLVWLRG